MVRDTFLSHEFAGKDFCIIGDEGEFEAIDIEGVSNTIYHRKVTISSEQVAAQDDYSAAVRYDYKSMKDHGHLHAPSQDAGTLATHQNTSAVSANVAATQYLHVTVKSLGVVMSSLFAALLAASAATGEILIFPLVGWIGLLFGISFTLMGFADKPIGVP